MGLVVRVVHKEDVGKLKQHAAEFQQAIDRDEDLRQIRRARAKLGEDIESSLLVAASTGAQSLMEHAGRTCSTCTFRKWSPL